MRSDHLSKHTKTHERKPKESTATTNEESSNTKTEIPPVDESRQLGNNVEENDIERAPKPTYSQELSIMTNQHSQAVNGNYPDISSHPSSQHGTTSSYTYENYYNNYYSSGASQAQVYHINYGNTHNYP